jgi:hypothetical protein
MMNALLVGILRCTWERRGRGLVEGEGAGCKAEMQCLT